MTETKYDGLPWSPGKEWPTDDLPPPKTTMELAGIELQWLVDQHNELAEKFAADRNLDAETYCRSRANYFAQRLNEITAEQMPPAKPESA